MVHISAQAPSMARLPRPAASPLAKSIAFSGISERKDPQPGYGWRNLASLLVLIGGIMGSQKVGTVTRNFHTWAEGQKFVQPLNQPSSKDKLLADIARLDRELRKDPLFNTAESMYIFMLRFQLLMLGFSAMPGITRKTLRLDQVYGELHQRGLTGKNLKVAVLDSGYNPGAGSGKNKVEFKPSDGDGDPTTPTDDVGHGTAVTNLITNACPDSEVLVIPFATDEQLKKMDKEITERTKTYIRACLNNPELLTLNGVRNIYTPVVRLMARGIRHAVSEGAHVVNVSLGTIENVNGILRAVQGSAMLNEFYAMLAGSVKDTSALQEKMKNLQERAKALRTIHNQSEALGPEMKSLMRPWLSALDYAHQKGTMVVVAAGNDGGHTFDQDDILARINLLGAVEHPALVVVGSTRQNGQVSSFTTEYNNKIHPWVAGNGSGELSTDIAPAPVTPLKYMLPPLWPFIPIEYIKNRVQYRNPQGTSFAAPDVAALILMMKSANPNLTSKDVKQILKDVAQPAHFGATDRMRVRMEVVQRLLARQPGYQEMSSAEKQRTIYTTTLADFMGLNTSIPKAAIEAEMQAELARRTGNGTLASRRLAAVEEAEKRKG